MSSTLCCLLSRAYDAWRAESCQKHLQRLLFDLIERWVSWWDEDRKSKRFSKFDVFNAIATIRRLSRLIILSSNSSISVQKVERIENKEKLEFDLSVIHLVVDHQIESCELYKIKLSTLKAASNELIKSCFFWVTHEDDFQIFNADWLWIEIEKNDRCENHDYNDFFKSTYSMRKSRWQRFFKS